MEGHNLCRRCADGHGPSGLDPDRANVYQGRGCAMSACFGLSAKCDESGVSVEIAVSACYWHLHAADQQTDAYCSRGPRWVETAELVVHLDTQDVDVLADQPFQQVEAHKIPVEASVASKALHIRLMKVLADALLADIVLDLTLAVVAGQKSGSCRDDICSSRRLMIAESGSLVSPVGMLVENIEPSWNSFLWH